MKKTVSVLIVLWLLASLLLPAYAIDESRLYCFELLCDGESECGAELDSVIDVTLMLCRTDSDESAEMYAVQDEIHYDSNFLELVPDSFKPREGVHAIDCSTENGDSIIKVDYILMDGTEEWEAETELLSFQLKVIDEGEISTVMSDNAFVTTEEGLDVFIATTQDLSVDCGEVMDAVYSVIFVRMNGEENEEVIVTEGEKLEKPETDPIMEDYIFTGWFVDEEYTQLWDFENDIVEEDMILYAGWEAAPSAEAEENMELWLLIPLGVFVLLLVIILVLAIKLRKARKGTK